MAARYPNHFPCPTRSWQWTISAGMRATEMDAGSMRVRRRFQNRRRTGKLRFEMTEPELQEWTEWMDNQLGKFIQMQLPLDHRGTGKAPPGQEWRTIRVLSDINVSTIGYNFFRVDIDVEIAA